MSKFRVILYRSAVLLLLLFSACSQLPEYARPHFSPEEEGTVSAENSFAYRKLTSADFRADSLPPRYAQYDHNIQARSCISIQTSRNSLIQVTSGIVTGKIIYTGKFTHIDFVAVFNPDCSWWNPNIPQKHQNYILQHEQIHFALTELTARRLNRKYGDHLKQYLAIGYTLQEVKNQLHAEAERISREGMKSALEAHTAFDEDTSMFYDAEIQQKWSDRVFRELNEEKL
tara:strand:- start:137 stop:823 length:687 start_codon:yes stop_codon:yes gene_type:complete